MKKIVSVIFFTMFISSYSFGSITTLKNCYLNKVDNEQSWEESFWSETNWKQSIIVNRKILNFDYAKKIVKNFDIKKHIDYTNQLSFPPYKCENKECEDYFTNNNLYERYTELEDRQFIINANTGIITQYEINTDEHINEVRKISKIIQISIPKKERLLDSTIINYTDKLIRAKSKQGADLLLNIEKNTITQEEGNSVIEYICKPTSSSAGGSSSSSGTAFFVSNKGHLITNNHVVDGCSISRITYQNKDYDTELLATDKILDLALLKADLRNKSYLDFSGDEAKKMQKIYVGGYPLGKGLSDDLKITSGIISSLKGFEDNSNEIQIDAAINPGNSGGPIINEEGELVAIAVSGLAKDQTEGINFGIKSSAAERFLKANKLKANKSLFSTSKNNDQLLEILEEATVYTYCN